MSRRQPIAPIATRGVGFHVTHCLGDELGNGDGDTHSWSIHNPTPIQLLGQGSVYGPTLAYRGPTKPTGNRHIGSVRLMGSLINRRLVGRGARAALLLTAFAFFLYSLREPIFRAIGSALVAQDSIAAADMIAITLDSGGAGALEAADLVQRGIASQVAVFTDPPSVEDFEFIRRGLPYEDRTARQIRQLRMLGLQNIVQIPNPISGSGDEARILPTWCDQHRLQSIVIVATTDHSRRLRRLLARSMSGHITRVAIHPSRYSAFDPQHWWEDWDGTRTVIIESQKLLIDFILHPPTPF